MARASLAWLVMLLGCAPAGERATAPSPRPLATPDLVGAAQADADADAAPPPVRPALPPRGVVTCALEGRFAMRSGERLLLGETGDVEARFTGHLVHVRIDRIDTAKGPVASAVVRAPASPPALMLHAKLRVDALPFRAAREIRVAGEHVIIPRGAALALSSGEDSALGVKPRWGDFDGVTTAATCDDVDLGEPTVRAAAPPRRSSPMHFTKKRITLFASAGGASLLDLDARRDGPTVDVVESRGDLRRIRYDDGVRIDAWVRASDLAPGEGPDCDDCHGGVMDVEDVCPGKGCVDEKGGPFHARRKVAVRDRPSPEGRPLGWLEEDGEVRIIGRTGTYARVEPVKRELAPPPGGLWIDSATLDPRGK